MRSSWLFVVALAACGRIDFTPVDRTADAAVDAVMTDPPRLIATNNMDIAIGEDVALADDGSLIMLGTFSMNLDLLGASVPSLNTQMDFFAAAIDSAGERQWLWTAGCTTTCSSQGAMLLAGGVVTGGYFAGTLTNGGNLDAGSGQDALMMWFGGDGQVQAAKQFGASRNVQIRGLDAAGGAVAIGGLYADTVDFGGGPLPSAGTNDNGLVAVFDAATRAPRFATSFNGAGDIYVNDVAVAADGSVCVTGRFNAATDFGGGIVNPVSTDAFIVRFDAAGSYRWHQTSRGPGAENGSFVTALDNGDCVASGYYQTDVDWDGHPLVVSGSEDIYVGRFAAADGAVVWLRTVSGPAYEGVVGIASHGNDRIALTGTFGATTRLIDRDLTADADQDGYIAILDGAGTTLAVQQLGGSGGMNGTIGGTQFDPSGRHVAAAITFSGEIIVTDHDLRATALADDAAVIVISAP